MALFWSIFSIAVCFISREVFGSLFGRRAEWGYADRGMEGISLIGGVWSRRIRGSFWLDGEHLFSNSSSFSYDSAGVGGPA